MVVGDLYVVDSSSWMRFNYEYPRQCNPHSWDLVEKTILAKRIISPVEVHAEITGRVGEFAGMTPLVDLCHRYWDYIFPPTVVSTAEMYNMACRVLNDHDYLVRPRSNDTIRKTLTYARARERHGGQHDENNYETPQADPFLIALAHVQREESPERNVIIVTEESQDRRHYKIPRAADDYELHSINLIDLANNEGWGLAVTV